MYSIIHAYYRLVVYKYGINFFPAKIKGTGGQGGKENHTHATAGFILTLPGKVLDISTLNSQHKFHDRGKKQGAVDAILHLEEAGLGVVHKECATRGTALISIVSVKCIHIYYVARSLCDIGVMFTITNCSFLQYVLAFSLLPLFEKKGIPENLAGKEELGAALSAYGISLSQYRFKNPCQAAYGRSSHGSQEPTIVTSGARGFNK